MGQKHLQREEEKKTNNIGEAAGPVAYDSVAENVEKAGALVRGHTEVVFSMTLANSGDNL